LTLIKHLKTKNNLCFFMTMSLISKKTLQFYLWGKKVKILGIGSTKKAAKLWEEINNRKLTAPEKKALEKGFDSKNSPK
jgi:hypothetical protein